MIVEFSVTNFGSIRDTQTLSMIADRSEHLADHYVAKVGNLRLLKLALLYGPNASGKTMVLNALEALRILATAPKAQKSESLDVSPFQFDAQTRQSPTVLRLVFVQKEIRYDYTVEVTRQCILREKMIYYPRGREAELFSRETDREKQVVSLRFGRTARIGSKGAAILEGNTLWNNTVLGAFGKSNVDWPELQEVCSWFEKTLAPGIAPQMNLRKFADEALESPKHKALMVNFLQKADVQISGARIMREEKEMGEGMLIIGRPGEEMDVDSPNNIRLKMRDGRLKEELLLFTHEVKDEQGESAYFELPWNLESSGTLQYYGLAAVLAELILSSTIFPIDEIESALHPDLMKHFMQTFLANAGASQLIVTTHNVQMLDNADLLRKDAVWFTQKRSDGSTELYSLADFDGNGQDKNGFIINAYKMGKFGAVPHTGSIFIPQPQ